MIAIAIIVTIKLNISKKGNSICAGHCIENVFAPPGPSIQSAEVR